MKFSTVLGTFALSTLEALHAYASPLELDSQSLEGRGNSEYCCVVTVTDDLRQAKYVSWTSPGGAVPIENSGDCRIVASQTATPPSQGGCSGWKFQIIGCDGGREAASASVQDSSVCK